jgi:hypothetical protein
MFLRYLSVKKVVGLKNSNLQAISIIHLATREHRKRKKRDKKALIRKYEIIKASFE